MFGIKFIKVQPTTYLLQYRGGKIVCEGVGMSFFYYAPTTSLVAVPGGSTDTPFSDGIEKDFLEFNSGTQAVIGIAERKGVLVE
jgi:hypothetical protein